MQIQRKEKCSKKCDLNADEQKEPEAVQSLEEENNSEEEKKNATRIFYRSWEEGDKSNSWVVIDLKVVAQ